VFCYNCGTRLLTISAQQNTNITNQGIQDQADRFYKEGLSLFKVGKYTEALASCDKAVAIKPDYAEAWVSRGMGSFHSIGIQKR